MAVSFALDKQNLSVQSNEQRTDVQQSDFTLTAFLRCWWRPWWCRLWLTTTTSSFNITVQSCYCSSLPSLPSRLNTSWHHLKFCYQLRFQSWTSTDQSSNSLLVYLQAESSSPQCPRRSLSLGERLDVVSSLWPDVSSPSRVQTVLQVDGGQRWGFKGRLGLVVFSAGVAKILGKHENKNSEQLSIFQFVC